ncbi:MAG: hypothetical protein Q4B00_05630 [Eubacteriales bacterium]|nr:hypothetical protein [Eubacteriales bacterium]
MGMIICLLFLICITIYFGKTMYTNYRQELPLRYGQSNIENSIILLCIVIGQYTIPSAVGRLIAILIFGFAFLVIYAIIGRQNKKRHSGELFRFYQKEVTTEKRCVYVAIGVIVFALFLLYFIE